MYQFLFILTKGIAFSCTLVVLLTSFNNKKSKEGFF
jgi:hypothetical protein